MKQKQLLGLVLIAIMLVTSCDLDLDYRVAPDSISETTWSLTVTDSQNITASTILKYDETSYNIVTTYIKGGESVVQSNEGTYSYDLPTVTMVAQIGDEGEIDILVGRIHDGKMYLTTSPLVFERQF